METVKLNKKDIFILMIVVFILNLLYINAIDAPYIPIDEYGYLGIAAHFAKIDWTDMLKSIFYFSFGYPLIIYPLFLIFDNPTYIYKGAMIINCLLFVISIPLIYKFINNICNNISKNFNKKTLVCIILLLSFNVITVSRSTSALSEPLLIFLLWSIIYIFKTLDDNFSIKKAILLSCLLGYAYMVHQRSLVFIIATTITLLFMLKNKTIKLKSFLAFIFIIFVFIFITYEVKSYFINTIWFNSHFKNTNSYGSILDSLVSFFTLNGFLSFLRNLVGHIFYLGQSTFVIGFIGLYFLFKDFFTCVKHKNFYSEFYFLLFFCLSFLGTIFLSSLFFINPMRLDNVMYGRYTEILYLPITCYGVIRLIQSKNFSFRLFLVLNSIFLLLTIILDKTINNIRDLSFSFTHNPMLSLFKNQNNSPELYNAFIVSFLVCMFLFALFKFTKISYIIFIVCSLLSGFTGYYMLNEFIDTDKYMYGVNKDKLIELRNSNKDVYFLFGSDNMKPISYIQYYLFDKPLKILYQSNIDFLKKDISYFVKSDDYIITDLVSPGILDKFTLDKFGGKLFFLTLRQSSNFNNSFVINAYDIDTYHRFTVDKFVQSSGLKDEETIIYGPGIVLDKGVYKIIFDLEVIEYTKKDEKLATVAIQGLYPKETFMLQDIYFKDLPGNRFTCIYRGDITVKNSEINFIVTALNNSKIRINKIIIETNK